MSIYTRSFLYRLPARNAVRYAKHRGYTKDAATTSSKPTAQPLAFAFDIDGVLLRGKQGLPAAKRALAMLNGANKLGVKIPYILLTNGGGITEKAKAKELTSIIGHEIDSERVILAHTILKNWVKRYQDKPILVLGGKNDDVRKVAEGYGFKHVYTSLDVLAWNPATWPFYNLNEEERRTVKEVDFSQIRIEAAFVFHDPRHWSVDIQILCDLILSNGIIGGERAEAPKEYKRGQNLNLVFCNPDLVWRSDFPQTRLGQGAFKSAFLSVFFKLTGGKGYPYVQLGKPNGHTYHYAETALMRQIGRQYGSSFKLTPQIYMIGDNPASDIDGANRAGWNSVLVRTGVYDPKNGPPAHPPTHQVEDVEEAVNWAIDAEVNAERGRAYYESLQSQKPQRVPTVRLPFVPGLSEAKVSSLNALEQPDAKAASQALGQEDTLAS